MSDIAFPDFFEDPASFSLRLATNQRAFAAPDGGSEQVVDMGNDRWELSVSLPNSEYDLAARVEAFIASLRGQTNTVPIYHLVREVPEGSLRGNPVLAAPLFPRDPNLPITAAPGATLLAGDMLGCAGQLFQVRDDVVANGAGYMNVFLVNRSRVGAPKDTPVVWYRPTARFRLVSGSQVQYIPGYSPEVSFDFVEAIG